MASESTPLKIAVEEPRTWARRLTITVPAERVDRERQEVARRLGKRLKLPGFRKGKIPAQVLEKRYGPAIEHEAVERVVDAAYREALRERGFQPITQGEVEGLEYGPGTDLTFRVEFEIRPEITLDRLGGFRVTRELAAIAEADVDEVLERLRQERAAWRKVEEGPPAVGDVAVVEVTSLPAEETAAAPQPRRYELVVGGGQALPDLETAIQTLKPGEETETTVRIPPEEEGGNGTEERVHIRVLEVHRPEPPELDDEFARSLGEFEDLAALRAQVRKDVEREAEEDGERGVRRQLMERILEANPFDVPDAMVSHYLDAVIRPRDAQAEPDRIAEMRQAARPAAERAIKRMLVIERVADMEGLQATSSDLNERIEAIAERAGRQPGEVRAQLQKSKRLAALEEEITERKVFDFLKSLSTIE